MKAIFKEPLPSMLKDPEKVKELEKFLEKGIPVEVEWNGVKYVVQKLYRDKQEMGASGEGD